MNIGYDKIHMQSYLISPLFSEREKRTTFQARSKMITHFKANFRREYANLECPFKCSTKHEDSQENIFICKSLKTDKNNTKFNDFFGDDSKKLMASIIFLKLLEERENILENMEIII